MSKNLPQVLIINRQGKGNYPFPPGSVFMKIYFTSADKG